MCRIMRAELRERASHVALNPAAAKEQAISKFVAGHAIPEPRLQHLSSWE